MKYAPTDIAKLGTILCIWAHPDDEAWTSAGVLATARKNDQRVIVVTATRGEAGKSADENRWPQAELAAIRTKELEASLATLGVIEHHWLDYADSKLSEVNQTEVVDKLADIIRATDPNTIISFAKDGLTGHPDHQAVCNWTIASAQQAGSPAKLFGVIESEERYRAICKECSTIAKDIYFNTKKPATEPMAEVDLCYQLPKDIQELKRRALHCQASQTAQLFESSEGLKFIEEQLACECFIDLQS